MCGVPHSEVRQLTLQLHVVNYEKTKQESIKTYRSKSDEKTQGGNVHFCGSQRR